MGSSLREITKLRPIYFLPRDNFVDDVLIPCFHASNRVSCMVGFFSSESLAALAPGLSTYLHNTAHPFRLIVSPFLREEDRDAIARGISAAENVAERVLMPIFLTEDEIAQHTLRCLSMLLQHGRLELRIAIMQNALFHPKVWLFKNGTDVVGVHGSSNMTRAGFRRNYEQISVSSSWTDNTQEFITNQLCFQFERLWDGLEDDCRVLPASEALKARLVDVYSGDAPSEKQLQKLYEKFKITNKTENSDVPSQKRKFSMPTGLRIEDGPFAHQGRAVTAWCDANFSGVLEMATGSGKTITAMVAAHRLYLQKKPLLIVIAAPYLPLIQQWCDEVTSFGVEATNLTTYSGVSERARILQSLRRRIRHGVADVEIMVVSHDTLCTPEFIQQVHTFNCERLLVADEVHNLGRVNFINDPPICFEHRLGLSATPVRQYDEDGTEKLFRFFGPVVFKFTLEEAIGRCLVEYDYFVHVVQLTTDEMDRWRELTSRIRQNIWREKDGIADDFLTKLYRDRRALLETAEGKLSALATQLQKEDIHALKHTLIYTSDKGPQQLEAVNALMNQKGILFHQLTSEETSDRKKIIQIIESFQRGEIRVLTAKRVLDEGVNIPEICRAYVLASTTVTRQWVQRRGRLLRRCPAIGKSHSVVHDFIAVPPTDNGPPDRDARALLRGELRRVQEFASLARNAGRPDGPLRVIRELVGAVFVEQEI